MNGKLTAAQQRVLQRMGKADFEQPRFTGNTLEDLLKEWAEITHLNIQSSLNNSNTPISGRATLSLLSSIKPIGVVTRGNDVIAGIEMLDYYQYVDGGRGPTRNKGNGGLRLAIQDWIASKGIQVRQSASESGQTVIERNKSLAYVIARKIHRKGFKGNKFFSKVINDATFDELGEYLASAMGEKIALSVVMIAKEAKEFNNQFRNP